MRNVIKLLFVTLSIAYAASGSDLHIILSSTNTNGLPLFEAAHAVIRNDGSIEVVEDLIKKKHDTDPYDGLFWIDTNYSHRKAVLLRSADSTTQTPAEVIVLDFDSARVVKRCPAAKLSGGTRGVGEFLAEDPVNGLMFVSQGYRADPPVGAVAAVSLDSTLACGDSYPQALSGETILSYVTDGSAGVSATGSHNELVMGFGDRRLRMRFGPDWFYFPFRIPEKALGGFTPGGGPSIKIRNSEMEVVRLSSKNGAPSRVLVHLRRTDEWKELAAAVLQKLRSFGEWLAWSEYGDSKAAAVQRTKADVPIESPGSAEWRKENSRYGKGELYGLRGNGVINTGILHLYQATTDRHLTLDTKQGDSEILLVEGTAVYYRVLNRVYRASITDEGITNPQLLAKSDLLRDAHWAFLPK